MAAASLRMGETKRKSKTRKPLRIERDILGYCFFGRRDVIDGTDLAIFVYGPMYRALGKLCSGLCRTNAEVEKIVFGMPAVNVFFAWRRIDERQTSKKKCHYSIGGDEDVVAVLRLAIYFSCVS